MKAANAGLLVVCFSLVLLGASFADAAPRVLVRGNSHCPKAEALALRLRGWSSSGEGDPWTAEVQNSGDSQVVLSLRSPDGRLMLTRVVESGDCVALTRALAIIVEGYFLDLGLVSREELDADESDTGEIEAEEGAAKPETEKPVEDRSPGAREHGQRRIRWRVALGAGPVFDLPEPGLTAGAGLRLAAVWRKWALGLAVHGQLPATQGVPRDRVQSRAISAGLGLSHRFGTAYWIEPSLAAGLRWARVEALDFEARSQAASTPAVGLGTAFGAKLGQAGGLRLDLGLEYLTIRQRYRIEPRGVVGEGPVLGLRAELGVELGDF